MQLHQQKPSQRQQNALRRGTTAVEFAVVLPLALTTFFGLIEFSRVNVIRNGVKNAAYQGARAAIVPGGDETIARQKSLAALNYVSVSNATITITPATIADDTAEITVEVDVPLAGNLWTVPKYFSGKRVKQSCTLTREPSQSGY